VSLTVSTKAIKPKRLKPEAVRKEVIKALKAEGKFHQAKLKPTVRTWKKKPRFESLFDLDGGDMIVITGPTGDSKAVQNWVWTDEGTRPHIIRARNAPALRFRAGNIPKTAPRQFSSRVGGKVGPWRRPLSVRHPGTKPRLWSETLSKQRRRPFTRRMIKAVQVGSEKLF
jgi:hypothetical protein